MAPLSEPSEDQAGWEPGLDRELPDGEISYTGTEWHDERWSDSCGSMRPS